MLSVPQSTEHCYHYVPNYICRCRTVTILNKKENVPPWNVLIILNLLVINYNQWLHFTVSINITTYNIYANRNQFRIDIVLLNVDNWNCAILGRDKNESYYYTRHSWYKTMLNNDCDHHLYVCMHWFDGALTPHNVKLGRLSSSQICWIGLSSGGSHLSMVTLFWVKYRVVILAMCGRSLWCCSTTPCPWRRMNDTLCPVSYITLCIEVWSWTPTCCDIATIPTQYSTRKMLSSTTDQSLLFTFVYAHPPICMTYHESRFVCEHGASAAKWLMYIVFLSRPL